MFQFPKQTLVFGPRQVVARINQDQVIAPQITLWNQQGSQVIQGTLMVIPIEESLIYVRPLYLRAQAGRIPELTRVIVAYQNRIVMERTLEQAIVRLFGRRDRTAGAAAADDHRHGAATPPPAGRTGGRHPRRGIAWRPKRATPISARSRRSAQVTGRSTARRSNGSASCSNACERRVDTGACPAGAQRKSSPPASYPPRVCISR